MTVTLLIARYVFYYKDWIQEWTHHELLVRFQGSDSHETLDEIQSLRIADSSEPLISVEWIRSTHTAGDIKLCKYVALMQSVCLNRSIHCAKGYHVQYVQGAAWWDLPRRREHLRRLL